MDDDPAPPRPPGGPPDRRESPGPGGFDGMDTGRFSPGMLRTSRLLEIIGDPIRLRVLLSLYPAAMSTSDLVSAVPPLTAGDVSLQVEYMRDRGLIETTVAGPVEVHSLTDLGRRLALVALSFGVEWPE